MRTSPLPSLGADDATQAGALIALDDDEVTRCLFMAPHGRELELTLDGLSVAVVAPVSALGRARLGPKVGEVRSRDRARTYEVAAIA